jgi:hypothetical protein|tara:strand:+ start:60474 stop:60665 length:192 start_codon:yes stop_codon:yes gene_type:complete
VIFACGLLAKRKFGYKKQLLRINRFLPSLMQCKLGKNIKTSKHQGKINQLPAKCSNKSGLALL